MAIDITLLPPEIIGSILSYLNIHSLLSFGATSKHNQISAQHALTTLDLAVLPRQVHCNLALASQYCRDNVPGDIDPPLFGIAKTTNIPICLSKEGQNPTIIRQIQVEAQNQIATDILSKDSVQHLQSLSLHTYEIQSEQLTAVLGRKLPKLRNLELNFSHQYIHNLGTSSSYWRNPPEGTPCWNSMVGLGIENQRELTLRNLQSLKIDRAGLTSAQLKKLVDSNPGLRLLDLKNVTGVDLEFLNWLSRQCQDGRSRIQLLRLESCPQLVMQSREDFTCLYGMANSPIRYMSLLNCVNVREQILEDIVMENGDFRALDTFIIPGGRMAQHGHLEKTLTKPLERLLQPFDWVHRMIEVDPDFAAQPVVVAA